MKKAAAKAIASKYLTVIEVHYKAQAQELEAARTNAVFRVQSWLNEGDYRRKDAKTPYVPTFTVQINHSRHITKTLQVILAKNVAKFEAGIANVCEHGDHAAPPNARFCSEECRNCEGADAPEGEECASLCLRAAQFVRKSDEKIFRVRLSGHWTEIIASDGEADSVKWFGPDHFGYVSASKGHLYDKREVGA